MLNKLIYGLQVTTIKGLEADVPFNPIPIQRGRISKLLIIGILVS